MERKLYLYFGKNSIEMDLRTDIKWIHEEIDKVEDPTFLEAIKNLLKYRNKVTPGRISIEQYNRELDESEAQIERGEFHTQDQVRQIIDGWEKE